MLREEAQRQGVPVVCGKNLVDVRAESGRVEAFFADGTSAVGDFLVGADGIHSKTRSVIFADAPIPAYTGLISFGRYAYCPSVPYEAGVQYMVFGKKAFFGYVVKKDGEIYWLGNLDFPGTPTRKELQSIPDQAWKRTVTELYRDDPERVPDIIR